MAVSVPGKGIEIYQDLGGTFWEQITLIPIPKDSRLIYVTALEPFVSGEKSYLAFSLGDARSNHSPDFSEGEIWVSGIELNDDSRYLERCDDGGLGVARFDAEVLLGERETFVYYTVNRASKTTEIYRCKTGIPSDREGVIPSISHLNVPQEFYGNLNSLSFSWLAMDPTLRITDYEYRITEGISENVLIRDWTSAGLVGSLTVEGLNLQPGSTYYISLRAIFDSSWRSNLKVSKGISYTTYLSRDLDDDGLSDLEEYQLNTDAEDADSDDDGRYDGQEVMEGSNPGDSGSLLFKLENDFCAQWNGFLGMSQNIAEFINLTSEDRKVNTILHGLGASEGEKFNITLSPNRQFDILVHDLGGWELDSIGTICANIGKSQIGNSEGDLDGRMMHYRPDGKGSYDFVVAMPFENSKSGEVYVQTNTFYPSLALKELGYFVANWFTIVNSDSAAQSGTVVFYSHTGEELLNERKNYSC